MPGKSKLTVSAKSTGSTSTAVPVAAGQRPGSARIAGRIRSLRRLQDKIFQISDSTIEPMRAMKLLPVKVSAGRSSLLVMAAAGDVEHMRRQIPENWYISGMGVRRRDRFMIPIWSVCLRRNDDSPVTVMVSRRAPLTAVLAAAICEAEIKSIEMRGDK